MEKTPLQEILALEAQLRAALTAETVRLQAEEQAALAAVAAELASLEAELAAAGERRRIEACAEGAAIQAAEVQAAATLAARRAALGDERLRALLRRHLPRLLPGGTP
jgi:hypothetical protein